MLRNAVKIFPILSIRVLCADFAFLCATGSNPFQADDMQVQAKKLFPYGKFVSGQAESNAFGLILAHTHTHTHYGKRARNQAQRGFRRFHNRLFFLPCLFWEAGLFAFQARFARRNPAKSQTGTAFWIVTVSISIQFL
jgi:hypothetical protein